MDDLWSAILPFVDAADTPRRAMWGVTFGKENGGEVTGDPVSGSLLEMLLDPMNLATFGASTLLGFPLIRKLAKAGSATSRIAEAAKAADSVVDAGRVLYRAGPTDVLLPHFGTEEAAKAAAVGRDVRKYRVNVEHPAVMVDSGRAHNVLPEAMAEDIVAAGNPGISPDLVPYIRKLQRDGRERDAFEAIRDALRNHGYDGLEYTNANEAAGSKSVVPLDPSQVTPLAALLAALGLGSMAASRPPRIPPPSPNSFEEAVAWHLPGDEPPQRPPLLSTLL